VSIHHGCLPSYQEAPRRNPPPQATGKSGPRLSATSLGTRGVQMKSIDEVVDRATKRYLDIFSSHLQRTNGKNFYTADLVMFGLLNRNI
jgi:hypothetical protein